MNAIPHARGRFRLPLIIAAIAALALTLGLAACGDDDDSDTSTSSTTQETTADTGSAETVSITTANLTDAEGWSWDVEPTPTADTKTVEFTNDSDEGHALIFARLGEGYTVDEAYKLQGKKGSATLMTKDDDTFVKPGETGSFPVTETLEPGNYVLLCPLEGPDGPHYKLGQLDEFTIE